MPKICQDCRKPRKSDDAKDYEKCSACTSKWLYFFRAKYWGWYKKHNEEVQRQEYLVTGKYGDGT